MRLTLPRCAECGASIRARTDENCPFCGAALPWEAWDELIRARVEVIPCAAQSVEDALLRIERRPEFMRARIAERRRRARSRLKRERSRGAPEEPGVSDALPVLLWPGMLVLVSSTQTFDPVVLGLILLVSLALATLGWWWFSRRRSSGAARPKRRRAVFQVSAFVVLGSAPTPRESVRPGAGWRTVTLRAASGEEVRRFAQASLGLRAGACGIGWLRGVELARFQELEQLDALAAGSPRPA